MRAPPQAARAASALYSIGILDKHACLPRENSPPFGAFVTWPVFLPAKGQRPLGFDRRILGPEWVSQWGGPTEETFRRGPASLYVSFIDGATSFAVDYRGYER